MQRLKGCNNSLSSDVVQRQDIRTPRQRGSRKPPSGLYNRNVCFSPRQQREAATILFVKAKLRNVGLRLDSLARAVADLRRKSLPLAASWGRGGASLLGRLNSKVAGLLALQNSEVVGLEEPAKTARDSDFLRQGFPVMGCGLNW